jgi:hypothetical protein
LEASVWDAADKKERQSGECVLGATAVVMAVTKALEEGEDAQTHAMILSPVKHGWRVFQVKRRRKCSFFNERQ